jgi:hypothetical protein
MIITHLIGGLGNQLFQYAMARRIAYKNDITLKLDISNFAMYKIREFKLDKFNIVAEIATQEEIWRFKKNRYKIFSKLFYVYNSILPFTSRTYIKERFFYYDPDTNKLSDDIYLEGHWPSEKYFRDIKHIIYKEFTLKSEMDTYHQNLKKQIENVESVSVHIRRGDYISNPIVNQIHGTCSLDYYYNAMKVITKKIVNPHFFIFSDDPEWVYENFKIPYTTTIVRRDDQKDYEDLLLMSKCKNHIIANSSFSWWGAWLNPREDKLVISPAKWYRGADYDTRDLLPDSWITI